MKRPRNIDRDYRSGKEAAKLLRQLADTIENVDFVHWYATIYRWNSAWESPKYKGLVMTSVSYSSKKSDNNL